MAPRGMATEHKQSQDIRKTIKVKKLGLCPCQGWMSPRQAQTTTDDD